MSQAIVPPSIVAVDAQGRGIQIRFEWENDRFGQRVERVETGKTALILESVESDPAADWPDSPPIQQISVEQIGSAVAALGVGAAGLGHWSISVLATELDGRPALQFDVAARTDAAAERLGSVYWRIGDAVEIRPLDSVAPTVVEQSGTRIVIRPGASQGKTHRWAYAILA